MLILQNDADDAVPWYQGIEFFLALRRLGKEVYLFDYNGEPHGLRRRPNQKDYTVRLQQYFDHYLKGAPDAGLDGEGHSLHRAGAGKGKIRRRIREHLRRPEGREEIAMARETLMPKSPRSWGMLLWAVSGCALMAQAPRPMTLVDIINLPQVNDPQLSPDGRQIVFVESVANWKADKRIGHVWRVNADGSGLAQMTGGTEGENSPRWSPDGKSIAFIAKRGAEPDSVAQIYVISASGGEARPLTAHATAVSNIEWSPDGAIIYFRAADPKPDAQKAREKLKDDVFMFDENYEQQHLWSVAVAGGAEHRITQGAYSVLAYRLSEDGKKIAFHRAPTPLIEDGDQSEVWVDGCRRCECPPDHSQPCSGKRCRTFARRLTGSVPVASQPAIRHLLQREGLRRAVGRRRGAPAHARPAL